MKTAKYGKGRNDTCVVLNMKTECKSRTNRELEEMSKGEDIVKWIRGQMVSWLVHLERMEEDRMPKKIFTEELERGKTKGKTK
jgi:hypothetical protein